MRERESECEMCISTGRKTAKLICKKHIEQSFRQTIIFCRDLPFKTAASAAEGEQQKTSHYRTHFKSEMCFGLANRRIDSCSVILL